MPASPYFAAGQGGESTRPTGQLRVLIVDDEPDTTLTLTALLRDEGYDVKDVHSGAEALTALRDFEPADHPGKRGFRRIYLSRDPCRCHTRSRVGFFKSTLAPRVPVSRPVWWTDQFPLERDRLERS